MVYEIFLSDKAMTAQKWQALLKQLAVLHGDFQKWRIVMQRVDEKIHYFVETANILPVNVGVENFYFVESAEKIPKLGVAMKVLKGKSDFVTTEAYLTARKNERIEIVEINFAKVAKNFVATTKIKTDKTLYQIIIAAQEILTINFEQAKQFSKMSMPKFLDAQKILPNLQTEEMNAIMEVESFPYQVQGKFLGAKGFDLDKHALVLGASGSGKSKFLSLLIEKVAKEPNLAKQYHFLVIDPHAALKDEIGEYSRIIDFENEAVDLLQNSTDSAVVAVELLLDVFKGMMDANWNARLERVLRHSLAILMAVENLSFRALRKLLLDLEFRNEILEKVQDKCVNSSDFFLMEYSEIKSRNYTEAVAPIITMVDEVEMVPAFQNQAIKTTGLSKLVQENIVTILSLDRMRIGRRGVEMMAGLIIQQVMSMMQSGEIRQKVILIVDEVAVVANPVLAHLLAEARKYGLCVMLAGQYFGAIPEYLRRAITANVVNYFLFRVSRDDAALLSQIVDMKIPLDESTERKIKTLCELNNREAVMRVSIADQLQPAVKIRTLDHIARAGKDQQQNFVHKSAEEKTLYIVFNFSGETHFELDYILQKTSAIQKKKSCASLEKRLLESLNNYSQHDFESGKENNE